MKSHFYTYISVILLFWQTIPLTEQQAFELAGHEILFFIWKELNIVDKVSQSVAAYTELLVIKPR